MMIKKIRKLFRVVTIDLLIYSMKESIDFEMKSERYFIKNKSISTNKIQYYIEIDNKIIHESFLFKSLHIQKLIKAKGPTIGDCKTIEEYKGKSIYPYVINFIANEQLNNNVHEVFINVVPSNISSIKGIEKAGFKPYLHLKAKRFLFYYFNVKKSPF